MRGPKGWIVVLGCLSAACTFGSEASTGSATEGTGSSSTQGEATDESTASPVSNGGSMSTVGTGSATATTGDPATTSSDGGPVTGPGDGSTTMMPPTGDDPYRPCTAGCPEGFSCAQAGACAQPCLEDDDCPAPMGGTSEPLCATSFGFPFCVLPCQPEQCPEAMTCFDYGMYEQCGYGM